MRIYNIEQRTDDWYLLRLGKITSSKIKKALKSDGMGLIDEIVDELLPNYTPSNQYVSKEMQDGIDKENLAKYYYTKQTGYDIINIGFCVNENRRWLGLSPDGFIGNKYQGAIEIKCPLRKTHIGYIRKNVVPEEYKLQIYHYFIVNENQEWVDFVSFNENTIEQMLFIKRVYRYEILDELTQIVNKLDVFWGKVENLCNKLYPKNIFI